jgi:hypothetical protein
MKEPKSAKAPSQNLAATNPSTAVFMEVSLLLRYSSRTISDGTSPIYWHFRVHFFFLVDDELQARGVSAANFFCIIGFGFDYQVELQLLLFTIQ